MKCDTCGKEYGRGQGFHGAKYKQFHFCSQDCYEKYCKIKNAPKPPTNFKPEKGSDRRKFTDYIQEWTNNQVNWQWLMKQAKDISEEYELNWYEMYMVLKYCKTYEELDWNLEYGLYQFFPKYIEPMRIFLNNIQNLKQISLEEEETYIVKKPKKYIGKVEF